MLCKKEKWSFRMKSSGSELVNTRRPTVLSIPLQLGFHADVFKVKKYK
jgi:hypothetical protein